jgi:hypothetical protein
MMDYLVKTVESAIMFFEMEEGDHFDIEQCDILMEEMLGTNAKRWEIISQEGIKEER